MCGFVATLNLDGRPGSAPMVRAMAEMLSHRGPDDEGFHVDGPVALGHRRLSILDLSSAAHQPMSSRDGRYVLVYNGEIYGFQEIKAELQAMGMAFNSHSDTEVVLNGWAAWGPDLIPRLNGMFAFALWDRQKQTLFLVRDRYGVKPLYYARIGNSFCAMSEIKALLARPDFRPQVNKEALVEYLTFQNFFTERTLFQGVFTMPAGHILEIPLGGEEKLTRYWDYNFHEPTVQLAKEEYIEELDRLFVQAVERQMISDVEIGAYLSGGLDSGSIAGVAASTFPGMKTFTVGFDLSSASGLELAFDERRKAEHMSSVFGTQQYEMVLKAGDMEQAMPRVTWHLEEPRVGQSYPNYYAANLASRFCKVVLAGTGGDEIFGGYPWRYCRATDNRNFDDYIDRYFGFWQRLLPQNAMPNVFAPIAETYRNVGPRDIFRNVFSRHAEQFQTPADYINHSLYFEAKTFLHGLLVVEDKLSMAHSLESRVPFLDNDLVDFAMGIPVRLKLNNIETSRPDKQSSKGQTAPKFEKTRDGKMALRMAMERHVPRQVIEDTKQGFSAPDASWFKGASIDYVRQRLFSKSALIYDYLDRATIHNLVEDHLEGRENRRLLIWSLLVLEEWMALFAEGGWKRLS